MRWTLEQNIKLIKRWAILGNVHSLADAFPTSHKACICQMDRILLSSQNKTWGGEAASGKSKAHELRQKSLEEAGYIVVGGLLQQVRGKAISNENNTGNDSIPAKIRSGLELPERSEMSVADKKVWVRDYILANCPNARTIQGGFGCNESSLLFASVRGVDENRIRLVLNDDNNGFNRQRLDRLKIRYSKSVDNRRLIPLGCDFDGKLAKKVKIFNKINFK